MNREEFRNPPPAYRGVALWMLNDKLEEDEIARQLEGIAAAGWGALIARTFNGLRTEYLSEEWMAIMARIIAGAEKLGLRVWLQAGYMPSAIPNLQPARAHRGVAMHPRSQPLVEGETVLYEDAEHVYTQRVLPAVLDLLNPDAVTEYLNLAYRDPWESRFGQHFGKTVEAVWVDEPHFRPPLYPWSSRLPEVFQRQWGYNLIPHLPSLFLPVGDFHKLRHHYWRVVLAMFLEGYFQPVERWCSEHGVKFTGHLMGEDTLNRQIAWTGATMPCYEAMHLPGIDHLTMSLTWPSNKKFMLAPKQVSSVASQLGHREVLAEMYGVSSQRITFAERKQIAAWLMVLGINYRCYHGAFYSLRGRRKRIYVPHLSYQQPWWPDNRLIADPFARLSYALRQGKMHAEVMVLHPVESTFCLFDPVSMRSPHNPLVEPDDVKELDTRLVNLCDDLMSLHRGFEFGDETLLAKHGSAGPDGLRVGEMTYRVVLIPDLITIRRTTLELLERFAAAGGPIFTTGTLPTRMDGEPDPHAAARLARISRPVAPGRLALKQLLDAVLPPAVEFRATVGDPGDVWVQAREVAEGCVLFLTNVSDTHAVAGELRINVEGLLEDWDLETGEIRPAPCQRVPGGMAA
ncbi:MAG: glycosyl hydrolase, partial [Armatimonadota bacterium]|nr:glycosyl hydrolase [Armatimonadota bacterium]